MHSILADVFVREDIIVNPDAENFSVCFDHSCQTVVHQSVNRTQWNYITDPLMGQALSATSERSAIADAIGRMEAVVGESTGTSRDKARNIEGFGLSGQMDCIDESTNTTTYLRMLESSNLLTYHQVADRSTRFGLFIGMPHTTAVIRDISHNRYYAVDSWFFGNGHPPAIIDLAIWKSGWRPGDDQE